ncbi:MAG: hypothetical protein JW809_17155 [Pirellulales bacterium]|nr:hypothetical protein [Pirellulales bacterium]
MSTLTVDVAEQSRTAMGSLHQLHFVQRHAARLEGPFLEAGSKDYGNTQDLRSAFAGRGDYLGVDREAGPGVDLVLDLTEDFPQVDAALAGRRFGTIFCLSVLEHCWRPFAMADNLSRLLVPGGKLCVSAPFAFRIHAYPSDYWRFTPEGIRALFPEIAFRTEDGAWAAAGDGALRPLDDQLGKLHFGSGPHFRAGHYLRGLSAKTLQILGRLGPLRWLTGHRYVLAPTDVLMLGTRWADPRCAG